LTITIYIILLFYQSIIIYLLTLLINCLDINTDNNDIDNKKDKSTQIYIMSKTNKNFEYLSIIFYNNQQFF
jgi:hypothetical protein